MRSTIRITTALLALSIPPLSFGQTEPATELAEIVVTAERRASPLQDVPASIRSLDEKELQRLGADSFQDYAGFSPGMQLIESGPARTQLNMRGVTTGDLRTDRPEWVESVGLYLDETPIAAQLVNPNLGLMDMERIEVLRGPQPTLYGAGSLSGTVRMISRKPVLNEIGGRISLSGGAVKHGKEDVTAEAVVNLPLVADRLALRAVGFHRDLGGYIDNATLGLDDQNDLRQSGARLALRYVPVEALQVDAQLVYQDTHQGGRFEIRDGFDLTAVNAASEPLDSDLLIASVVLQYDFAPATFTSATSYFTQDAFFRVEAGSFTEFILGADDDLLAFVTYDFQQNDLTQEFRVVSRTEGRVSWIAGLFLQRKERDFLNDAPAPGFDAAFGIPSTDFLSTPDNLIKEVIDLETTQIAPYAEITARFQDRWSATGGLRWFRAKQDSTVFFGGLFAFPNIGTTVFKNKESGFNPKFSLTYDIDAERMLYAQASRGFRLGGTNEPIPEGLCGEDLAGIGLSSAPPAFDSDDLWNYELGLKSTWLDRRLRVNGAAYYIDWKQPPVSLDLACGFPTIINVGAVAVRGVELEVDAALARGLVARLGFAYTDSELSEDVPLLDATNGDRTPYTPRVTGSVSMDYDFPIGSRSGNMAGFAHLDWRYVDDRITGYPGGLLQGVFTLASYTIANARFGLGRGPWELEAFVSNVFDKQPELTKSLGLNSFTEFAPGAAIATLQPRTIGLKLSWHFDQ